MRTQSPKSIHQILLSTPHSLSTILEHAKKLQGIRDYLAKQLPATLNQRFAVANLKKDKLTLSTDSSAWALRLRFHIPMLLHHLKQSPELKSIHHITIRISPRETLPTFKRPRPTPISAQAAKLIKSCAKTCDPALEEALIRLSRHAKNERHDRPLNK